MASRVFLEALQSKLKGGNARSIHLNALPGRLATRFDIENLNLIEAGLSERFLNILLSKAHFEFKITFDKIDLNLLADEMHKKLGLVSKRLNSILIENEDYYKEHGTKTLAFGYPILIRRSTKDPEKIIKAPLFIWSLEAIKSKTKVNEWSIVRNMTPGADGKLIENDIHPVSLNEVLLSFIKGEDGISLPGFTDDALEDSVIDKQELLDACIDVLNAINTGNTVPLEVLAEKFKSPVNPLPDATELKSFANNNAYIHFGGVLGLFRAQKESIINDITRLLDRVDQFEFDNLQIDFTPDSQFSAVRTDPSQQSIISSLGTNANQIIQGPPGTGKSQSLTALITNALANDLKCLVVCEKKTALEVIKQNLDRTSKQLGSMVAVIDNVNDDREAIVDSVRDRQIEQLPLMSKQYSKTHYDLLKGALAKTADEINTGHKALDQIVYGGQSWSQLVGRFMKVRKRFQSVPLNTLLSKQDFSFVKNHDELNELLPILSRAENLYGQNVKADEVFKVLSDPLFASPVGEARNRVDAFVQNTSSRIKGIREYVDNSTKSVTDWLDKDFKLFPSNLREELNSFISFWTGDDLTDLQIPGKFQIESKLEEIRLELSDLFQNALDLRERYKKLLEQHYHDYNQDIKQAIGEYLTFVDSNASQFGTEFFKNSSGAKLKTNLLSIVSKRQKTIKANRLDLRSRIHGVKIVHQKFAYIDHSYNDHSEVQDLHEYVRNVHQLHERTNSWFSKCPETIQSFLELTSPGNLHPEYKNLNGEVQQLFATVQNRIESLGYQLDQKLIAELKNLDTLLTEVPKMQKVIDQASGMFNAVREFHTSRRNAHRKLEDHFVKINCDQEGEIVSTHLPKHNSYPKALDNCNNLEADIEKLTSSLPAFRDYHEWRNFYLSLDDKGKKLIEQLRENKIEDWKFSFECWYLHILLSGNEPDNLPKSDTKIHDFKEQKENFGAAQVSSAGVKWVERQMDSVRRFKKSGQTINGLFNKKGSKGNRRNSLRTILRTDFQLFTDFFPVILLNPSVCSSIIPLEEGIFDIVIFDEASQLRLEDTFPALIRGKSKIVSGDKHQMAPSSYFEGSGAVLDPLEGDDIELEEDEDVRSNLQKDVAHRNLADSESLLAYAEDKGFIQSYLDVHYRSQHPFLIDFSNHAFYGKRLIPIPCKVDYKPIEFIQVDGIYEGQTNKQEALRVVELLRNEIKPTADGTFPSVGVATFNIYQRNLIIEEIASLRQTDPMFDQKMAGFGDSFFVKNLENIQGDERDIIILSTTFGRKVDGSFTQNFGPIIQGKGHRMLNVIVTRAKYHVYVCTSFPTEKVAEYPQLIQKNKNRGRGVLYAYLAYAKAVSDRNDEVRESILGLLGRHCTESFNNLHHTNDGLSESPFEQEVYERLVEKIGADRVIQQYSVGGFRIDMVVLPQNSGEKMLAIECDGAKYHSSPEAYAWDVFRQEQLEKYGFRFHRIWSTKWWDDAGSELAGLLKNT